MLDQKTHTIVFARYSYEDVRLFNLQSLLIRPILQPDRAVRLSRFGASLVRDTRERCERGLLGAVRDPEEADSGVPGEICRYNQIDATRGYFFSVDYALALHGNTGHSQVEIRAGIHIITSPDELIDIDTPEDLERLRALVDPDHVGR